MMLSAYSRASFTDIAAVSSGDIFFLLHRYGRSVLRSRRISGRCMILFEQVKYALRVEFGGEGAQRPGKRFVQDLHAAGQLKQEVEVAVDGGFAKLGVQVRRARGRAPCPVPSRVPRRG